MEVNVRLRRGGFVVDAAFHGAPGGITALFGPSGAGKSSVINMVAGLLTPDEGRIAVNGRILFDSRNGINLPPEKRRMGYIFQEGRLFPHMSVKANLLYGRCGARAGELGVDFGEVTELLGIARLLDRRPNTLSGGEKQRVAFGRAVLSNPDALLMDEPLASLDAARKAELLPFISRLNESFRIPVLYVSHSEDEIRALGCAVVSIHEGKIAG